ncbi:Hypothetical protein PHPALM_20146 [Phytophthora palmivora]|uniref:Uncharacterized protein n=1 Tax=Phytophthora palmivora TaxID=4796 RepID=A0A2P4XFL5_9STRA|nr:Hypothetical protein PHPALM_20146 [Phytophthora palmivora]
MDIETTKRLPDRLDLRLLEDFEEDTTKEDEVGAGGKAGENAKDDESGDAEQEGDTAAEDAAVDRAFDVTSSDLEAAVSQRDPDANLQLLSEVSGAESEGEQDEDIAEAPARVLRPRVPVKKDNTFVSDDENLSSYESFSSGESIVDEIQEDDGHFGRDSDDDEVISESNAAELDEAFVEALRIGNDDTSKAAKQQRSATLRGMRWS